MSGRPSTRPPTRSRPWPRGAEPVAAGAATASRPPLTRRLFGRHPIGYLFVAPYVVFLFAIFAYPLGFAVYMSFYDYFFAAPGAIVERPFVGFDNYTTALADPTFHRAMLNVVIFIAINVPLTVFVGLLLATALNAAIPFRTFFRASYFVPYVTASVAVIGVWLWLFNANGLVNSILGPLAPDPSWLVNRFWAMPIIALFATWKQLGFYVLLYLAAHHPGGDRGHHHRGHLLPRAVPAHRPRRPRRGVGVAGPADVHPGHRAGQSRLRGRYRGAAGDGRDGRLAGEPLPAGEELTVATATQPQPAQPGEVAAEQATAVAPPTRRSRRRLWPLLGLGVGALVFLFPFYYMVIGALQREPNSDVSGAFPNPANLTLDNLRDIDQAIDLPRTLLNSGIFTGGVLLSTLVLGLLAGYALARLEFRGKGMVFNAMLLVLIVPFQLLMIPLYVMIVRGYLLGDTYLGMILPFAVNAIAVFIFRQFFLQLPKELFESARLDGASELKILTRIAIPLAKPAILTAVIVTFIGPWNEFLWPFLVTKQLALQPLAVALANFISNVAARQANPFGAILAGAVVLVIPAVILFLIFQKRFQASNLGSGIKG